MQQTLDRVEAEIRAEDATKIQEVELEQRATQHQLDQQRAGYRVIGERLVNRCAAKARRHALTLTAIAVAVLVFCISSGFWLPIDNAIGKWILTLATVILAGWHLLTVISSSDAARLYRWLRVRLFRRYLSREASELGFDLGNLDVEV